MGIRTRTRVMAALFVAGLVLAPTVGASVAVAQPQPSYDGIATQVSPLQLSATHVSPSMVIDRDDPDTIYLAAQEAQTRECRFYVSADAGRTWSEAAAPDPSPLRCQVGQIAPKWGAQTDLRQGADGTLYFAYHASEDEQADGRSVVVSRSRDGAESWETTVIHEAAPTEGDALPELNNQPRVAIDPSDPDRVYAVWTHTTAFPPPDSEQPRPDFQPYLAVSEDGGETFGEARPVAEDVHLSFESPVITVTDEAVHVVLATQPRGDEETPSRVVDYVSTDGGDSFEANEIATAPAQGGVQVLHDPDRDEVHVVWMSNAEDNINVYHARSAEGSEWTEPQRLNTDSLEAFRGHYFPRIAQAPGGRIDVVWYDYRHDTYPPNEPEDGTETIGLYRNFTNWQSVYARSSDDGGRSWSDDYPVTGDTLIDRTLGVWSPQFFVLSPPAVVARDDGAVFAWSDTRNGNADTSTQDIFARRMAYGAEAAGGFAVGVSEVAYLAIGLAIGIGAALLAAARRLSGAGSD